MASLITIPEVKECLEGNASETQSESAVKTESDEPVEEVLECPELNEKSNEDAYTYTKPIEDPLQKAYRYLSKHDILSLFQVSYQLLQLYQVH
jgi:hypothetical protein